MVFTTLKTTTFAPMPKRKDQHRNHSEGAVAPQRAKGEPQVLPQNIQPRQPARLAMVFLRLLHSTKRSIA